MPENRTLSAEIIGRAIDLTPVSRVMVFIVIVATAGFFFDSFDIFIVSQAGGAHRLSGGCRHGERLLGVGLGCGSMGTTSGLRRDGADLLGFHRVRRAWLGRSDSRSAPFSDRAWSRWHGADRHRTADRSNDRLALAVCGRRGVRGA
jgi:hypothetical protein